MAVKFQVHDRLRHGWPLHVDHENFYLEAIIWYILSVELQPLIQTYCARGVCVSGEHNIKINSKVGSRT